MSEGPLKVWLDRDDMLLRLRLNRPKANVIDGEMVAALNRAFAESSDKPELKGILLDHEGPNFSYGASVEEHLPGQCAKMLKGLHALIGRMIDFPVPILVQIRGQCLGGGLEVACAGHLLFAAPDAVLGQPEIKLAVFAPAASCILPERIGPARAEDILFSGRSVTGNQAAALGLVTAVADQPEEAALAYFDEHLAPLSGSSLRFAVRAARKGFADRVRTRLNEVEELYLSGLMSTHDAVEGLQSFIEKRPAKWENR